MVSSRKDLKLLRNPSCGAQNMAVLRHILTAAPSSPRCICHRQRSATKPDTLRVPGLHIIRSKAKTKRHPQVSFCFGRGRRTWSRLPARSVLLHFVQRSPPETRTPRHAPRAECSNYSIRAKTKRHPQVSFCFGRGRRTWSRLPARSVLLHFVQRSPPETRTPRHAPRAECSNYSIRAKTKRHPQVSFCFGRGRRT